MVEGGRRRMEEDPRSSRRRSSSCSEATRLTGPVAPFSSTFKAIFMPPTGILSSRTRRQGENGIPKPQSSALGSQVCWSGHVSRSYVYNANVKNALRALSICSLLNVSSIKHKLSNIPDQRILGGHAFHVRASDNGAEAKLADLSGAGREQQLAAGERSPNQQTPAQKQAAGLKITGAMVSCQRPRSGR